MAARETLLCSLYTKGIELKNEYIIKFKLETLYVQLKNDCVGRRIVFWVKVTKSRNLTFAYKKYGNVEVMNACSLQQLI